MRRIQARTTCRKNQHSSRSSRGPRGVIRVHALDPGPATAHMNCLCIHAPAASIRLGWLEHYPHQQGRAEARRQTCHRPLSHSRKIGSATNCRLPM
eukprot:scaffold100713_cov24-Tisochrysis_lutea.AAC.1